MAHAEYEAYHRIMAILLILLALFGSAWGFGSGSTQRIEPSTTQRHVQKSEARAHVTVRARATVRSSVSCSARVTINGASVQTNRRCRNLPVKP